LAAARLAFLQRRGDHVGAVMHEIEEAATASGHDMPQVAVGGELVHVGIHMNHERGRTLA
jgi:hypothetical protein